MSFVDRIMVVVDAASSGAVKELEGLQKEAKKTDTAFDTLGKKFGVSGQTIKAGLVAGATALIGTGLVSYLGSAVDGFADAAKGAGELASATGGTAEEVSRMQAAFTDAGISADQSAGLITKFTVQVGKSKDDLAKLNVQLVKNQDGSTNYAATMVDVLDAIQNTGDAAERSRILVQFFGRQGAQSFQELLDSGMTLSEAMESISKLRVFDDAAVERAKAYDDAMDNLGAAVQGVQYTLGGTLIPLVSTAAEGLTSMLGFVMDIPGPMRDLAIAAGLAAVGVAGLGKAMEFLRSEKAGALLVGTIDAVAPLAGRFYDAEGAMGKATVAAKGLAGGLKAVATAAAPLVALTIAVEAVMGAMKQGAALDEFTQSVENSTRSWDEQVDAWRNSDSVYSSVKEFLTTPFWMNSEKNADALEALTHTIIGNAEATLEAADATNAQRAAAQRIVDIAGAGTRQQQTMNLATEEGRLAVEAYNLALGASAAAAQKAQDTQRELADIVADSGASHDELAGAVAEAADAQAEQNRISETSKGLMEAYASSTWDAVDATLALFDKQFAAREGQRKFNDQVRGYGEAMKEAGDSADEQGRVLDDLAGSALDAAAALAEQDRQNALNNGTFLTAAEVTAKQVEHLKALRDQAVDAGMPQPVIDSLNSYIASLETAQATASGGITVETDINLLSPEQVASKVDVLKKRMRDAAQSGNWGLVDAIQSEIDSLTTDKTVNVTTETSYSPGGYEAVKARKDYLVKNVSGKIDIQTVFGPDGYQAVKARKDYLTQDRTAYIDIVVRGAASARSAIDGLGRAAAAQPQQLRAPQVVVPQPVHFTRVEIDGRELRAVVRDEVGAVVDQRMAEQYAGVVA